MPANKEALIRYRAINRCLIDRKIASKNQLIEACSSATDHDISWRTIAEDIRAMRNDEHLGFNAPIENIINQGYKYSDENYSIDKIPLNSEEITALSFASNLLNQYREVGIFSTFSGAVQKLSEKVSLKLRDANEIPIDSIISFEKNTAESGGNYIDFILESIRTKTVLSVHYFSFSSKRNAIHVMHPYYLKEYRNRWYVVGWHEAYKQIRTLALERIENLEHEYSISYFDNGFDPETYYHNAIGISVDQSSPVNIELKISLQDWPYFESQPWHHSMKKVSETKEHVFASMFIIVNYEFRNLLLSYASSVEVLSPTDLRTSIATEFKHALKTYSSE